MSQETADTAEEMNAAIAKIFEKQMADAERSEYDWKVCVNAVAAARAVFAKVPVSGSAGHYLQSVLMALEPVYESYYDPDGEYTSGKASIGNVFSDLLNLRSD